MTRIMAVLILVASQPSASAIEPLEIRLLKYKAAMDKSAATRIANLELEKKDLQKRLRVARSNPDLNRAMKKSTAASFAKAEAQLDGKIAFVKAGFNFMIIDTKNGNVGDIGWMDYDVEIVQIIGPAEALLSSEGTVIWVTGFSTEGKADGQELRPSVLFEIAGTKQYTGTSGAKRTVRHLKVVSWSDWEKAGGKKPPPEVLPLLNNTDAR